MIFLKLEIPTKYTTPHDRFLFACRTKRRLIQEHNEKGALYTSQMMSEYDWLSYQRCNCRMRFHAIGKAMTRERQAISDSLELDNLATDAQISDISELKQLCELSNEWLTGMIFTQYKALSVGELTQEQAFDLWRALVGYDIKHNYSDVDPKIIEAGVDLESRFKIIDGLQSALGDYLIRLTTVGKGIGVNYWRLTEADAIEIGDKLGLSMVATG